VLFFPQRLQALEFGFGQHGASPSRLLAVGKQRFAAAEGTDAVIRHDVLRRVAPFDQNSDLQLLRRQTGAVDSKPEAAPRHSGLAVSGDDIRRVFGTVLKMSSVLAERRTR
jgi:hypothetical protein